MQDRRLKLDLQQFITSGPSSAFTITSYNYWCKKKKNLSADSSVQLLDDTH